jgi:hypothetical protein
MKAHNIAGPLMGQIFESTIHKYISRKFNVEFICRKLAIPDTSNPDSITESEDSKLNLSNFEVLIYDANTINSLEMNLKDIIHNSKKNLYLIPKQSNADQVDSIYYDQETNNIYFFQITTSTSHSFRFYVISKLAQDIGFAVGSVRFVFIVPESIFSTFTYNYYMTKNNQRYKNQNKLHSQMVASFSNINDINDFFIQLQTGGTLPVQLSDVSKEKKEPEKSYVLLENKDEKDVVEVEEDGSDEKGPNIKRTKLISKSEQ